MLTSVQHTCPVDTNGGVLLLQAFDEPHEPATFGLPWGGLFSSAHVEPQQLVQVLPPDPALRCPAGCPDQLCVQQALCQCPRPGEPRVLSCPAMEELIVCDR